MPTAIHRLVRLCREGREPRAIVRLPSGWVLAGDVQALPGACLLACDPVAPSLNALGEAERARYARDQARLGDALIAALGASRVNYETWCNLEPALHSHVTPRFAGEPPERRVLPPRQAYDYARARRFDPDADRLWMARVR
ncbi:MAG: hypothetical protein KGM24_13365, partial [Elusimicrobia bacterium]|nr:hypothetical protein [Elusimicrobiota bacterium]